MQRNTMNDNVEQVCFILEIFVVKKQKNVEDFKS